MKNLCIVTAVLIFCTCAFATTATFTLTTDGSGNASHVEKVPFGTFRLSSFSATASFGSVQVKTDGALVFNAAVAAGQSYAVTGAAKSAVEFVAMGGPANASVTVTVNYTWGSLATARTTETFTLTTDGAGNATHTEKVPFGTFRLSSFSATASFGNVQVKTDGVLVFNAGVAAGQTYAASGAAKKAVDFIATGGPANSSVTVTVNYTWGTTPEDSRSTETFTMTTDGAGNAAQSEKIAFGTFRLSSFVATASFGNVQVKTDGVVVFNAGVAANQTYAVSGAAKRLVEFIATGGPANTAVTVTVTYTLGAADSDSATDVAGNVGKWTTTYTTDIKGNIREESDLDTGETEILLLGFKSNMDFATFAVLLDGERVFPCACCKEKGIVAGQFYRLHPKMVTGKHTFAVLGTGGIPSQEVEFVVYYK